MNKKTIKYPTNIGTYVEAVLENGKLITDSSEYKRVKDTKGIYRITKYSDSWLNLKRIVNS